MKPPLFVLISRGAIPLVTGLRKRFATLLIVAAATGLGAGVAFSQGPGTSPGNFYQQNPVGSGVTGGTYYGELAYVQSFMPAGVSIYNPPTAGSTLATPAQLAAAMTAAVNNFLSASPSTPVPAGVTLASIATQITANNPAAAAGATSASGTMAALATSIVANQTAANAYTSLSSVISSLATANPSTISSLSTPIFTAVAANASEVGYIPRLTLAATTATTAVSSNDQTVGAIVTQALDAVASSVNSQQATLQSIVTSQFSSPAITGSQASIGAIAKSMLNSTVMAVISSPNTAAYVQSAVNSLPSGAQTNVNVGAIFDGMVASGSLSESAVVSDLSGASSVTAGEQSYLSAMNTGYNSTAGNIASNIAANPGLVDAVIAGAVVNGMVANTTLVTDALSASGSTPIQSIVAAAINSDVIKNATSDNSQTIAADAVEAVAPSNYAAVAQGAVGGGRAAEAGGITSAMIKASPGYSATYSSLNQSTFTAGNVQTLVAGALTGAYGGAYGTADINAKPGAVGQIVYQSEVAASNFSGATAANYTTLLPLAEAVATQAITTMKALDTVDAELPTYLVAAAAFAGYGGTPTNLPTIQGVLTNQTTAVGLDSSSNAIAAINAVEPIVQNYRTTASTGFTQTLAAFQSYSGATPSSSPSAASDSVLAILFGASISNSSDASALLAAAVGQVRASALSSIAWDSDANLLATAIAANPMNQGNLTIANTVAVHLVTNFNASISDVSNYVGLQVAQNLTYVNDIAAAAVTVDPNQTNYVARAVAFNDPQGGYTAIPSIFAYSQLTSKPNDNGNVHIGEPSNTSSTIDMASAAAAISAGYASGLIEAGQSTTYAPTASNTLLQQAFVNGVSQAVSAAITQNNTRLTGQTFSQAPTSLSALPGGATVTLQTVNGVANVPVYSGTATNSPAVGAAGVVTGLISQLISPTDTTIGSATGSSAGTILSTTGSTAAQIVNAILKATVFTIQNGATTTTINTTNNAFVTQIAQAAGQAWGYITNGTTGTVATGSSTTTTTFDINAADAIANDLTTSGTASNYKLVLYAAYYGITQGQSGVEGAGASGISAVSPYGQNGSTNGNPVTGAPVTDIFNL